MVTLYVFEAKVSRSVRVPFVLSCWEEGFTFPYLIYCFVGIKRYIASCVFSWWWRVAI